MKNEKGKVGLTLIVAFSLSVLSCGLSHPPFDSKTPDTKNNKFHFKHLVHLDPPTDVHDLYTYGSEVGIDASYLLAFKCKPETVGQIVEANDMEQDANKGVGLIGAGRNVSWWNTAEIDTLNRYVFKSDNERYFKYLWYNDSTKQAYFLDFDL